MRHVIYSVRWIATHWYADNYFELQIILYCQIDNILHHSP